MRAIVGLCLGGVVGALVALVVPRDEGPRRRIWPGQHPQPLPPSATGVPAAPSVGGTATSSVGRDWTRDPASRRRGGGAL